MKTRLAIIGLSAIERAGIASVARDSGMTTIESFGNVSDFMPSSERFDIFAVSSDALVSALDFFLPKRQRVAVFTNERHLASKGPSLDSYPLIVSANEDIAGIEEALAVLSNNAGDCSGSAGEISAREADVLKLIASGKTNKEIADILCISINTVITHRKNISSKLGIKSASGLSLYAVMNGYL